MGQLCLRSFPPCCVLCAPCQFPAPPLMPASPHHLSPTCDVGAEGAASRCLVPMGGLVLWRGSQTEPAPLVWVHPLWPGLLGGPVLSRQLGEDVHFPGAAP